MSNCMTCFGRGTTIGPNGPQPCSSCGGGAGQVTAGLFADWYRQYGRMVRRIAAAHLNYGDLALVEDIAQEAWLGLWRYVTRGAAVTHPAALLGTITRHMVGMHYRQVAAYKRPRAVSTDYTEPTADRLSPAHSAEDIGMVRMAARDQLDSTTDYGKRHAPRRTDRLIALAVAA